MQSFAVSMLLLLWPATPPPAAPDEARPPAAEIVPLLVTPDQAARRDADGIPLPPDAVRRIGSGKFRLENSHLARVGFSPSGQTVYVATRHQLAAFDAQTGRPRYVYRHGSLNLSVATDRPEGVHVEFAQGRREQSVVVLEHDTGRELRRDRRPVLNHAGRGEVRPLTDRRFGIVTREVPRNPRFGPSSDVQASLWNLEQNRLLIDLGEFDPGRHPLVFSPREERLACQIKDRVLRLVEISTGALLREETLGPLVGVSRADDPVWSSDGRRVYAWRAVGAEYQIVEIPAGEGEPRVVVRGQHVFDKRLAVSPNGKYLAYARRGEGKEKSPFWQVVHVADGSPYRKVDLSPEVTEATFAPDDESLWLLGECGLLRYDLSAGSIAAPGCDPVQPVEALAFSTDGKRLFGVAGGELITWDAASGKELPPRKRFEFARAGRGIRCLSLESAGRESIWSGENLETWRVVDGEIVGRFYRVHALSPNGNWVVHASRAGGLVVSDFQTGALRQELYPDEPDGRFRAEFAPDHRTLAVLRGEEFSEINRAERDVDLWDVERSARTGKLSLVCNLDVNLHFTADSRRLKIWHSGPSSRQVSTFDLAAGKLESTSDARVNPFAQRVVKSSGGRGYAFNEVHDAASRGKRLQLVDLDRDAIVKGWHAYQSHRSAIAVSPDEAWLAVACPEGPVVLVDFRTGVD